jgi:hypothetical protein
MATTFLAAAQEFITRLKLSGSGPSAVTGQPREYQIPIRLLASAHKEIVASHIDWTFLWGTSYVEITTGGNPHTANVTNIKKYDESTFRRNSDGEYLGVVPWVQYKKERLTPTEQASTGKPEQIVIQPDKKIIALPFPDANGPYRADFDYWRCGTELTADDTVLDIPDDCIETLYHRARMLWLDEEESPQYQLAKDDFMAAYTLMEMAYWPGKGEASMAEDQEIVVVSE